MIDENQNAWFEAGASVNSSDRDGRSFLFIGAGEGNLDLATTLLAREVALIQARTNGVTSLFMAALEGHLFVVELLLGREEAAVN